MGRAIALERLCQRFLKRRHSAGLTIGGLFTPWLDLYRQAQKRRASLDPKATYFIDPAAGLESFVSLLAVLDLDCAVALWATPEEEEVDGAALAPALYRARASIDSDRPLWGVKTSGTTGKSKMVLSHSDQLEAIALLYERSIFEDRLGVDRTASLATALPLQYSASFFMMVIPAMLLPRDLLVYNNFDWGPLLTQLRRRPFLCLSVPSAAQAGSLAMTRQQHSAGLHLLLGGGAITGARLDALRIALPDAAISNIYGTAETGALAIDVAPGHNAHVGAPIQGKAVWLENGDSDGVGTIASVGIDCRRYLWTMSTGLHDQGAIVRGFDRGQFDAAGNLVLKGRVDDAVKLNGTLVFLNEIRAHFLALDAVVDVAAKVETDAKGIEFLNLTVIGAVDREAVAKKADQLPQGQRPRGYTVVHPKDAAARYSKHGKL